MGDGDTMCPHRVALGHVTSRWGILAPGSRCLTAPTASANYAGRSGKVSEKMLTQTLQTLERDGLVHRDAKPVIPPHVDYCLTDLGRGGRRTGPRPRTVDGAADGRDPEGTRDVRRGEGVTIEQGENGG
ncbi:hypothetical protein SALBM311S_01236 [Streptomyces alboniger]